MTGSPIVPSDGIIAAQFCGLDTAQLASGAQQTCTLTVALTEPAPSYVRLAFGP